MGRGVRVRVTTTIDESPARVWADIRDISSHTEWMGDAIAIRFTSARHNGVGTTFDCDTRVGPLRLTDRMEITEWKSRRSMGIRHVGLVTGEGRFVLKRTRGGRTRFRWTERLQFPWWMGGPVGGMLARPVLKRIWRKNLRNLAARFESN